MIECYGFGETPAILDKIKDFGYKYVTKSGITWALDEVRIPEGKKEVIASSRKKADEVTSQFNEGLLSEEERYRKTIEVWQGAKDEIEKMMPATLDPNGPVSDMLNSGARGSISQIVQMAGMKGLIVNTSGRTIDFPIIPSSKEGLSPIEYFVTTHGSRKGLADTALNTAKAGYLTRRLVDVAQDAIITEEDCKDKEGKRVSAENLVGFEIPISKNIRGRILSRDIVDSKNKVIFKKGTLLYKKDAQYVEEAGVEEAYVRSPLTCKSLYGVCRTCYGLDTGRNKLIELGEAVGIIAAQAIGEPGTQLTMRTFHAGGIASVGGDITAGLPRVEEIFERRIPKSAAIVSNVDGEVLEIEDSPEGKKIVVLPDVGEGKSKDNEKIEYYLLPNRMPIVKVGSKIKSGDLLTDGSADISEIFKYGGKDKAENYIINEVNKIYELQGASIARKHIEVIIRQMFSRRKVKESGDTKFAATEVVEFGEFIKENKKMEEDGKEKATGDIVVLGISDVAITTKSWLSAASFENTTRVLIDAAVKGKEDKLRGLKENVILGRKIPAGTGFGLGAENTKDSSSKKKTEE